VEKDVVVAGFFFCYPVLGGGGGEGWFMRD